MDDLDKKLIISSINAVCLILLKMDDELNTVEVSDRYKLHEIMHELSLLLE